MLSDDRESHMSGSGCHALLAYLAGWQMMGECSLLGWLGWGGLARAAGPRLCNPPLWRCRACWAGRGSSTAGCCSSPPSSGPSSQHPGPLTPSLTLVWLHMHAQLVGSLAIKSIGGPQLSFGNTGGKQILAREWSIGRLKLVWLG